MGSDESDNVIIKPKGFLLLGFNSYDPSNFGGKTADVSRTKNLPNGESEILLTLYNSSENELDSVLYSSSSITKEGDSIERKSVSNKECVSPHGQYEFYGNSCDTNLSSDFVYRDLPYPQNSASLIEPRIISKVLPVSGTSSIGYYSKSELRIYLLWSLSTSSDPNSLISYKITERGYGNRPTSTINISSTSTSILIDEVGRVYEFEFIAYDNEGKESEIAVYEIYVNSFFDSVYFYPDTRANSSGKHLFDLYYSEFPFVPGGSIWDGLVFYINRDPNKSNAVLSTSRGNSPNDENGVAKVIYPVCFGGAPTPVSSLIIPISSEFCGVGGGLHSSALSFSYLEDNHLLMKSDFNISGSSFNQDDYITVAFYRFSGSGGGEQRLSLIAMDMKHYNFQNNPPQQNKPVISGDINKSFDELNSKLILSWPIASDSDSLGSSYELNFTPSSELSLNPNFWNIEAQSNSYTKRVQFEDSFLIGVRAKDDFGNISENTLITQWSYPEISFGVFQNQSDGWSDAVGAVNQSSAEPKTASFQSITPQESFSFNKIAIKVWQSVANNWANLRISAYPDNGNNSPNFAGLIGESNLTGVFSPDINSDIIFTFSPAVSFSAGSKYWLVFDISGYPDGSRAFFRNEFRNLIMNSSNSYIFGDAGKGKTHGSTNVCDECGFHGNYQNGSADWYMKIGITTSQPPP